MKGVFGKMKKLTLFIIILGSLFFSMTRTAYALVLDYTTVSDPLGIRYDFTLNNNIDSLIPGDEIWELFISVPMDDDNFVTFGSPVNWGDGFGGAEPLHGVGGGSSDSFVEWFADLGGELSIGSTLSGFSFVSVDTVPGSISYSVNSLTDSYTANQVPASSVIPESPTLILLGIGLLGTFGFRIKGKIL